MKQLLGGLMGLLLATGVAAEVSVVAPESVSVDDADTLWVDVGGERLRIQLPVIDAPEDQRNPKLQRDIERTGLDDSTLLELGGAATHGLQQVLADFAPFRLRFDRGAADRYGRIPGDLVAADGSLLSVRLVADGYAVPLATEQAADDAAYREALQQARAAQRGLWGSHGEVFARWSGLGQ